MPQTGFGAKSDRLRFAVARNEAVRLSRRSDKACGLQHIDAQDLFGEAPNDDLATRETSAAVTAALGRLSPGQREVVELKMYAGLTFAEIAEVTGAPLGTVATRYRAAAARLRQLLARTYRE